MSLLDSMRSFLRRKLTTESPEFRPFKGVGTLWLSDICGFDGICEGMSPEAITRTMNAISHCSSRCIHESRGVIVQSSGDAILAVWEPTPSHAELALETGKRVLALRRQVQSETGIELHLRIALATGTMTGDWIGGRFQVVGAPYAAA